MATAIRDGTTCCCSRVHNVMTGLCRTNYISCPYCIATAHMQDSYNILTSSYGSDSKVHRREHVLAQRGREVGPDLESGAWGQAVCSFRETHLRGRFHQELWGLAANVTACWTSQEHCIPLQLCLHSAWTAEPWAADGHVWTGASLPVI